jgi:tetratricopeptide (TPR) repeat protein
MRWRISNTRWHFEHWYSYVGTKLHGTWGGPRVSRRRPRALGAALAVALLAGCASGGSTPPPDPRRLQARAAYERGLAHLQGGQASMALGALREAVALDGAVPAYHNTLGLLLLQMGRPDLALDPLGRAVALDPGYADAYLNQGIALAELGRWQDAVPAYRKALSLPPFASEPLAHQNLGLALYHLGRFPEAEQELRLAIALDPRMEAAYYNLGLLMVATHRPEDARAAFRYVREIAPQSPFARAAGEQLRGLGDGS